MSEDKTQGNHAQAGTQIPTTSYANAPSKTKCFAYNDLGH
eukprot:CAMPEP_0182881136 /NCGR_PEP_ID=MMETSP0034_2-20130328/17000_1 /TAXON_ID=156128 /ORGANISM="Nephroselmis pyriformis, Strain CCMP717" /LENGTH=39 /DNA_ID= /DNA_START= /DNA_END= /DNA_ORIENTATION=